MGGQQRTEGGTEGAISVLERNASAGPGCGLEQNDASVGICGVIY